MDDLDSRLDDVVVFELPAFEDVEAFRDRFRSRWAGWWLADGEIWLFGADLRGSDDIAALLRSAQELLADLGLASIRFFLDDRAYVLDAARRPSPGAEARRAPSDSAGRL